MVPICVSVMQNKKMKISFDTAYCNFYFLDLYAVSRNIIKQHLFRFLMINLAHREQSYVTLGFC